jgi:hypothetical protein
MTRTEALAIATQKYLAFQSARTAHDFGRGPEPKQEDYGYRHGWVSFAGFSFGSDEMVGPSNQPWMD